MTSRTRKSASRPHPTQAVAIDLGATSGRLILGTLGPRSLKLREIHRFPNRFDHLGPHCYWNLPGLLAEILQGLRLARRVAPELASCGVDTWGCDSVLLDRSGRLVYPTHAYRDTRTEEVFKRLAARGLDRVYEWTGQPNLSYNTSLQLQEIVRAHPGMTKVAKRCLFLSDYFNFLLSGRMANEMSVASTSQLLDARSKSFSTKALNHFGIPPSWFTKPRLSPAPFGAVTGHRELDGLAVTLVPGHDTSCAYDAMPADENGGDIYLSSGTWSLLGFESDQPLLGPRALDDVVCNERLGDGRFRPLKTCLGLWLLEQILPAFSRRPDSPKDWEKLITDAEKAPAPRKLINVTDRALFNPASMKDAIDAQLKRRRAKPPSSLAHYTRLICESLGQGHADGVAAFEAMTGRKFNRILMVGGGSKNRLLCQTTANRAGIPVVSLNLEGTAVGNLANQFIALGAVENLASFRRLLGQTLQARTFEPAG
ncbi:MAG: rhamnulokinase [Puniceicoccaceae bacterium]|nr:MAG: rhamnulokinase [Puniceicoccaceae bacterium]